MAAKVVHILISRTCEHVTLYGKRDFANVINVKDLEMGRLYWISREPSLVIEIRKCRKLFLTVVRKGVASMIRGMQYCWI